MNRKEIDEAWDMMLEISISMDETTAALNDALLEFGRALKKLEAALEEAEAEE